MTQTSRTFCLNAIAYLKVEEQQSDEVAIELSEPESPVIKSLGHRLLITYVGFDEGEFVHICWARTPLRGRCHNRCVTCSRGSKLGGASGRVRRE